MKFYPATPIPDPVEISDFEKEIGVELEVRERPKDFCVATGSKRYYTHFDNLSILEGSLAKTTMGQGNTVDEAITDCVRNMSGKQAQLGWGPESKRFEIPQLQYTKKYGNHWLYVVQADKTTMQ